MIETITMTISLVILGYAFYISSNLFWIYKSHGDYNRWVFTIVSTFIISSYIIFSFVLFAFITEVFTSFSIMNNVNLILSIFLLSGAGLIGALMKYYVNTIKSSIMNNIQNEVRVWKKHKEGKDGGKPDEEKMKMVREIVKLKDEIDRIKSINRFAVGNDLRIIELKKKLEGAEENKD